MKIEAELKKLAEFAAEFLKLKSKECLGGKQYYSKDWLHPNTKFAFFDNPFTAPQLAHLAKREMEKRGWYWHLNNCPSGYSCDMNKDIDVRIFKEDDNEYIALWSAIEETGEK